MTRTSSCHLLDILAEVPDPRHKKGNQRHDLVPILANRLHQLARSRSGLSIQMSERE